MIISKFSLILPGAQKFPIVPQVRDLDQLLGEILLNMQKNQCYVLHNHRVKFAKNGKILIPEDFYKARKLISLRQHS